MVQILLANFHDGVREVDRITVPHTASAVIVSVADSLSPLRDALLGSNARAEFKVTFEMRKPFIWRPNPNW